ncbi:MAG: hypothetical protein HY329_22240 [Chloroflexi bacterium]|nr:hypothetical protein [Chloroflexota bacterium]
MPEPTSISVYRARRDWLIHRLARIEDTLARWNAYQANERLPVERRQELKAPLVSRSSLEIVRQGAIDGLLEWEQGWERRN